MNTDESFKVNGNTYTGGEVIHTKKDLFPISLGTSVKGKNVLPQGANSFL